MTIDDFNNYRFGSNVRVEFKGRIRDLFSVNLDQALIGLVEDCQGSDEGDIEWVRCENVAILNNQSTDKGRYNHANKHNSN